MYKNWLKKKQKEQQEAEEDKKKIDELLSKLTLEDWTKSKTDEFDIELVSNPEADKRLKREEEKVNSILDGTFWNLENLDFEELADEEIGKRGREILGLLKPFYRKDLYIPNAFKFVFINITKELRQDLTIDESEYRIEADRWSSKENGIIINCDEDNIWYRKKYESYCKNIEAARKAGKLKDFSPSLSSYHSGSNISLRGLYEERIENGFNARQLRKSAYSNDLLEELFFLYVIKRAQLQDDVAAELLFNMYENAVVRKAEFWIKGIELRRSIKFKQDRELGVENVKNMAMYFLRLLISGDDPEYLFEYIKKLDDKRNIELFFTRALGKKIKDLVKFAKRQLEEKTKEYKILQEIEERFTEILNYGIDRLPKDEVNEILTIINKAKEVIENKETREALTYRTFLHNMKLDDRLKELSKIYFEVEDYHRSLGIKRGYPCLDEPKFEKFTKQEKEEFFALVQKAESKTGIAKENRWYSYMELINADEFTETGKKVYKIITDFEETENNEFLPRYATKKIELAAFADPYSWLDLSNWFNDKKFNATKNNNFTNWLLKSGNGKPSAIEQMLLGWIRSETFMSKEKFKAEFLEDNSDKKTKEYLRENLKDESGLDELSDEEYPEGINSYVDEADLIGNEAEKHDDANIRKFIDRFLKTKVKSDSKKQRNKNLLIRWIEKKNRKEAINYGELGKEFGLKKRQTIKVCKEFEEFGKKHLKNK